MHTFYAYKGSDSFETKNNKKTLFFQNVYILFEDQQPPLIMTLAHYLSILETSVF